jgi:hypothetical protein
MSRGRREFELLDALEAVIDEELPYVLVGGWAISAFQPRFTVDVDVVAPSEAIENYRRLLAGRGYEQVADVEMTPVYRGRTVRFEKDVGNPVTFDLMLDSLGCRQTDAEWSFRYLSQHSRVASLETRRRLEVHVPERELLFALKLHSGRKADARDLVVLGQDADFDRVEKHLQRGDPEKRQERVETVLGRIDSDGFADAFKGVIQQGTTPEEDVERVVEFCRSRRQNR